MGRFNLLKDIVYYCDAYPAIGMGHLKRGIDILNDIYSCKSDLDLALTGKYSESALAFIRNRIPQKISIISTETITRSKIAVVDTMFKAGDPCYIDPYYCRTIKSNCQKLILISSGLKINVPASVDVLVDHLPDVHVAGNNHCRKYIGFEYSPVNFDFFNIKRNAVFDKLLCVIGGSNNQIGPLLLVNALNRLKRESLKADIIVSPHFPKGQMPDLITQANFEMNTYQNVKSLIPFFSESGAIICTYGNITYEAIASQIPTYTIAYAPFQYDYSEYLSKLGLVINLGFFDAIDIEKLKLVYDKNVRDSLYKKHKNICRKPGIANIAKLILREAIYNNSSFPGFSEI